MKRLPLNLKQAHPKALVGRLGAGRVAALALLTLAGHALPMADLAMVPAARAQALRTLPATAAYGEFEIRQYPEAGIDGKPARLAAGAQIRNPANLIVQPASLSGRHPARYQLDPAGQLWRVWLLTPEEARAAKASQ